MDPPPSSVVKSVKVRLAGVFAIFHFGFFYLSKFANNFFACVCVVFFFFFFFSFPFSFSECGFFASRRKQLLMFKCKSEGVGISSASRICMLLFWYVKKDEWCNLDTMSRVLSHHSLRVEPALSSGRHPPRPVPVFYTNSNKRLFCVSASFTSSPCTASLPNLQIWHTAARFPFCRRQW